MQVFTVVLSVWLAGTPATASGPSADKGPSLTVSRCLVSLIDEAQVPAQEAGVLVRLSVRESQQVAAGDLLGEIDLSQAKIAERAARLQLNVAQERVTNDINHRYAKKAAEVARAEYDAALTINSQQPRTVPEVEVKRLELVWQKATLQIEQALHDLKVFGLEARVREAELDTAKNQVERRQIRSPLSGVVVKRYRHAGEWVKPGDPAFHVVRMDQLRIEGFVNQSEYAPWQVDGRPVTVEVELAGGRRERFSGRIRIPSPMVEPGGDYRVWAEVANRQQGRHWLLQPGQLTEMTIHLDRPSDRKGPGGAVTRSVPR